MWDVLLGRVKEWFQPTLSKRDTNQRGAPRRPLAHDCSHLPGGAVGPAGVEDEVTRETPIGLADRVRPRPAPTGRGRSHAKTRARHIATVHRASFDNPCSARCSPNNSS